MPATATISQPPPTHQKQTTLSATQPQQKILPPGSIPQLPSFLPLLNRPAGAIGTQEQDVRVPTTDTVRIAILLPLTGSNAQIGKALLNAAQLALFDFADSRFELLPHDTKGNPEGAANAARFAISDGPSPHLHKPPMFLLLPFLTIAQVPATAFIRLGLFPLNKSIASSALPNRKDLPDLGHWHPIMTMGRGL